MVSVHLLNEQLAKRRPVSQGVSGDLHAEGDHQTPPATTWTVTLERQPGTPAEEVARSIGSRLGWPVYNHELLEVISRDLHVPIQQLEEIDERGQSWLLECIQGFSLVPGVSENTYFHRLVSVIRTLATRGNCVIVGHGAGQLLPTETNLRVRLVGVLEDRIANLSRTLHLSHKEAARKIKEIARQRTQFIRDHFQEDPSTADHYDLVLNTSRWSAAACTDLIEQALLHKVRSQAGSAASPLGAAE